MDALGPFFGRFLLSHLWRGENFFMQIDAHTVFRSGWDDTLVEMIRSTPTYPNSVVSNYPPSGAADSEKVWARYDRDQPEPRPPALCGATFEDLAPGKKTVRLQNEAQQVPRRAEKGTFPVPTRSCFIAAGFFFAHGSSVEAAPFDPFLPFIFMGEEIILSMRFWTSGFDIYGPSVDVLQHEYVRKESQKFWESVDLTFSKPNLHNDLTRLLISRIHFILGFPEAETRSLVHPESLLVQVEEFMGGKARSVAAFMHAVGMDLRHHKQRSPSWCVEGTSPPPKEFQWS